MQRLLIILSLFILIANGKLEAQWQVVVSPVGTDLIRAACFVNQDSGWAVGEDVIRTTNGGKSWSRSAPSGSWNDINFINDSTGFVVGRQILKTDNGGKTWRLVHTHPEASEFEPQYSYKSVRFKNDRFGIAAGYSFEVFASVYITTDGGESWHGDNAPFAMSPDGDCRFVSFSRDGRFFVGCMQDYWLWSTALYFKVSEAQDIWSSGEFNINMGAYFIGKTMFFNSNNVGWIGGFRKSPKRTPPNPFHETRVLFTTDVGKTWDTTQYHFPYTVNTITFADSLRGFIGDTAGNIYSTTDGGTTWKNDNVPSDGRSINSIAIAGGTRVFAVGDGGLILRYDLPVSVQESNTSPPLRLYPNPTTGRVRVDVGDAEPAVITIIDMMGRVQNITVVLDNELDVSMLTTGTYVVLVRRGSNVSTALLVRRNE